jgi:hypothetical protein
VIQYGERVGASARGKYSATLLSFLHLIHSREHDDVFIAMAGGTFYGASGSVFIRALFGVTCTPDFYLGLPAPV